MIEAKYTGVELEVHHNNEEEGFSGQLLTNDEMDTGYALTKLVVRK